MITRARTRIAAGESWYTRFGFKPFIEQRGVDILQPEPGVTGGITEAWRIAIMGSAWELPCVPHAWGTGIILAAGLQLSTSIPNGFILEYKSAPDPLVHVIASALTLFSASFLHSITLRTVPMPGAYGI